MRDFVDLPGASGTQYRFRRMAPVELSAMAGNLVIATGPPRRMTVLFCGAASSLDAAAAVVTETLKAHPKAKLFVRLNVARATRDAEHADLVAGLKPEAHTGDLD